MSERSQKQEFGDITQEGPNNNLQVSQAGRKSVQINNSPNSNNTSYSLFGGQSSERNVNWDWAVRNVLEPLQADISQRLRDLSGLAEIDIVEMKSLHPEESPYLSLEAVKKLTVARKDELLDPQMPIIQIYDRQDIQGKLLILGMPGAGKTTMLLKLAEQLIQDTLKRPNQQKKDIPVIFELSTWQDGQEIKDWLIEQLCENYGKEGKREYKTWLQQGVLVPLLDGLDELGKDQKRQRICTKKVNNFAKHYPKVVVCCRVREFQQTGIKLLSLRGEVQLQPLNNKQIQGYLALLGKSALWRQIQTVPEMRQLLDPVKNEENPDNSEPGLLRIPLFISLAARVYEEDKILRGEADLLQRYMEQQLSLKVREEDRQHKKQKNSKWTFKSVKQEPSLEEIRKPMIWLALNLQKHNKVELLCEKMQPSWLRTNKQKKLYCMVLAFIAVLVSWLVLVCWLIIVGKPSFQAVLLLFPFAIIFGVLFSASNRSDQIELIENLKFSKSRFIEQFSLQNIKQKIGSVN